MSLRPVNRVKHVFDEQGAIVANVNQNIIPIIAVDNPALASSNQVETASVVNGFYMRIEIVATTSAALPNVYMIVLKNPGGNLGVIAPNTVGTDDDKRYVIHQEMVMMQQQTNSNPRTLFNGVIKIPRGYRRFGPNDAINVRLLAPGVNISYCIQVHYKEFR